MDCQQFESASWNSNVNWNLIIRLVNLGFMMKLSCFREQIKQFEWIEDGITGNK